MDNKKGKVSFVCDNEAEEERCNAINGKCVDCSDFALCARCINKNTEICEKCRLNK